VKWYLLAAVMITLAMLVPAAIGYSGFSQYADLVEQVQKARLD